MATLIARNDGGRPQAIRVHGGHTILQPGDRQPVTPCPDLDEKLMAHFASRGVTFSTIDDAEQSENETGIRKPARTTQSTRAGQSARKAASSTASKQAAEEVLLGSSILPALIEVAPERTVPLGEIVALAHKVSGLSVEDWNSQPDADREAALAATIDGLKATPQQD
ncbi:hypothetical protein [Rhizobium straminoryzae]|uniref:Uncharacterized protein n=1 Tax=Rhizobium straminoryzae TaxID=1387186 RepID=A0A549T0U7_9HYPH|nr:hypothetical protein [Rhizobium straminoryzae]TRL35499.1 hypothetical protein FNA46_20065 [Rhizobium straminoryzae]